MTVARRLRFGLLVGAAGAILALAGASTALAASASVTINNYTFTPHSIAVTPGTTITWTNKQADDNHTVTADNGTFDTGVINKGGGHASLTFNTVGTFTYHCKIHPFMHGTVVVSANATTPPPTDETPFDTGLLGGFGSSILLIVAGGGLLLISFGLVLRRANAD
jgi:plastocyanin